MAKPSHQPHACQACGAVFSRLHTVKQHWQKKAKANDSHHQGAFQPGSAMLVQANEGNDQDETKGQETEKADERPENIQGETPREEEEEDVDAPYEIDDTKYDDYVLLPEGSHFDLNPPLSRPYQYPEPEEITWCPPEPPKGSMPPPPLPPAAAAARLLKENVGRSKSDRNQLRSSRTTRNQDPNTPAARGRAGVIDYDPTEGLPVRKWERVLTRVRQDDSTDANGAANEDTTNTEQNILSELPLPSFYNQLPPHSQLLLRAARMPNRNVKLSVWNKEKECWERPDEAENQATKLKSRHLLDPEASQSPVNGLEDNTDKEGDEEDADGPRGGIKKRKTTGDVKGVDDGEKYYEVMKWTQIPLATAEKMEEKKYLADRRPGMPSLYGGAYQQTNGYGVIGVAGNEAMNATAGMGFDLGDGSGLGNAAGVLSGPGQNGLTGTFGQPGTPVRKNMPPRRKKKKLGGPGRKKAVPVPIPSETITGDVTMTDASNTEQEVPDTNEVTGEKKADAANEEGERDEDGEDFSGSDSDGEDEGSEEGEIGEHLSHEESAAPKETEVSAQKSPATNPSPVPMEVQDVIQEVEEAEKPETSTKEEELVHTPLPPSPAKPDEAVPTESQAVETEDINEMEVIPEVERVPEGEQVPELPMSTEMVSEPVIEHIPEPQPEEATLTTKPTTIPSEETDLLGGLEAAVNDMEKPE